jgi:hypothetical protein
MGYKSFSVCYPVSVDTLPFGVLRCCLRGDEVLSKHSCLIKVVVMKLEVTTVHWCTGIRSKIIGTKSETQGNNNRRCLWIFSLT